MSGADILTCLLVDDDELFREGLLRAIRGLRLPLEMKFMQAGSGEEALKKVAVEMPSLVFLDYRMPGLSGLECLRKIAPCIIIDCSSYIANDILSAVSLMEADSVLRLTGCDLKSVSYFSSQLPLLKESKWDADKQYKAASNVRPNEASAHMEQVLGNTVFQIPYSREVEEQVLQGNLFKELGLKESRGFRKAIEAVTGEVFGC